MKSTIMRGVITDAKRVMESKDFQLVDPQNRLLITHISKRLNAEFKSDPRTVSAIIRYIEEHGFELRRLECIDTQECRRNMEEALRQVNPDSLKSIRAICESMFRQPVKRYD
jgi:hypothetical protein